MILWFVVLDESTGIVTVSEVGDGEEEDKETTTKKRGRPKKRARKTPGIPDASRLALQLQQHVKMTNPLRFSSSGSEKNY